MGKAATLSVALALLFLSGLHYWAWTAHKRALSVARTEAERFEAKVAALQGAISQEGGDLGAALATAEQQHATAKALTLGRVNTNFLVREVSAVALQTGVKITSYSMAGTTQDKLTTIYLTPVSLSVEAPDGGVLAAFLTGLQKRLPGVRAAAAVLPYSPRAGVPVMQMTLTLNVFSTDGVMAP
jgi:hypothetical protein